jgi:putative membrane protein
MANERTFLAWIRTSIGIMAFGFVVEKFGLFVKQVSCFLGASASSETRKILEGADRVVQPSTEYSSIFGISLIGLGALMGVLAFIRYKKTEKQIDLDTYHPSLILDMLLTISILVIGIFIIIYLLHSV